MNYFFLVRNGKVACEVLLERSLADWGGEEVGGSWVVGNEIRRRNSVVSCL